MISAVPQPSAVNKTTSAPPDVFLRAIADRNDRSKTLVIGGGDLDGDAGAHAADSHPGRRAGIPIRTQA